MKYEFAGGYKIRLRHWPSEFRDMRRMS